MASKKKEIVHNVAWLLFDALEAKLADLLVPVLQEYEDYYAGKGDPKTELSKDDVDDIAARVLRRFTKKYGDDVGGILYDVIRKYLETRAV